MMGKPWTAGTLEQVLDRATAWLLSDNLRRLVLDLGGPQVSLNALDELLDWSSATLESRHGRERREAQNVEVDRLTLASLVAAAGPLGLIDTPPPTRNFYDAVILLAGAVTGNRLRTELVRQVLRDVGVMHLLVLASDRPIGDSEIADDPHSVLDAVEWRNIFRYLEEAFGHLNNGLGTREEGGNDFVRVTPDGLPVRFLVAPAITDRRPNTRQQLQFLRDRVPLESRRSTLLVTSAIYTPYQFFAGAPEVLADGANHVEIVGTKTTTSAPGSFLGQRLAQEIHAAIDSARGVLTKAQTT